MRVNFAGAAAAAVAAVTLAQITDMDAGMRTFNATPSSANLAAAVTDETGTGALVFGTTPTFSTPKISDGSGHAYRLVPGTLAADRDLSLPVLAANDTIVTAAATQTLTNKTFTAPVLGAATGTSLALGTNPAAAGILNLPSTQQIRWRNAANNADVVGFSVNGSDQVVVGLNSANNGAVLLTTSTSQSTQVVSGSTTVVTFATSLNTFVNPLSIGTTPATTGILNLPNNSAIYAKSGVGNEIRVALVDTSSNIVFGINTAGQGNVDLVTPTSAATRVWSGASIVATFATALNTFVNPTTITKGAIAVTSTDGLSLVNATAATSGVPAQYSTRFVQTGTAYNSVSTLSETQSWMHEVRPASNAGATGSTFAIACSLNGGAYLDRLTIATSGTTILAGAMSAGGNITASSGRLGQTLVNLGVTSTDGALLQNTSSASVGVPIQWSPRLRLQGGGYNSTSTLSETHDVIFEVRPTTSAGTTSASLAIAHSVAGGAYVDGLLWSFGGFAAWTNAVSAPFFSASTATGFSVTAAAGQFSRVSTDAAGSTTDCFIAKNAGAATLANQRWSPALHLTGAGWNITAGASRVVDARTYITPIQQASGEPTIEQVFDMQVNAAGYTTVLTLVSTGGFKLPTASATPPNPAAGSVAIWFDGTNLKAKNSAGVPVTWA